MTERTPNRTRDARDRDDPERTGNAAETEGARANGGSSDPGDRAGGASISRRTVLRAGAGIGASAALAGCNEVFDVPDLTSYSFRAVPVVLGRPTEPPAYELRTLLQDTVERTPTVAGTEVDVELENHAAVYGGDDDTLGLLSTPQADVATRAVNPLATEPLRDILAGDLGGLLLQTVDLTDRADVSWMHGPELVETASGELLGHDAAVEAFAGVTERDGFVLLVVTRVLDGGDAVFAANGLERDGDAGALVGPDGYVTAETVGAAVERLAATLPRVRRGEAGAHLTESALVETDGTDANFVRVVVENRYAERPLYAVSLFTQFFDAEGTLLDFAETSTPSLEPGERFDGFVPFVGDGVAGYAVEATHTSRPVAVSSPDAVDVVADSRDGDTVAVTIRNASGGLVPYVSLEVTFYGENGSVLGTQARNVANLDEGEERDFDVVFASTAVDRADRIADYAVATRQYGGGLRYVR